MLKIPLWLWKGKRKYFTISLPGKQGLTAAQLSEWMAYSSIEPFGEFRNELRHGQLMSFHFNMNRDPKQRHAPYEPKDFMNFVTLPPERVLTKEEIEAEFDKIFG